MCSSTVLIKEIYMSESMKGNTVLDVKHLKKMMTSYLIPQENEIFLYLSVLIISKSQMNSKKKIIFSVSQNTKTG
jgi:hypothetical protein